MKENHLSTLPQIEKLLQEPGVNHYIGSLSRPLVTEIVRSTVEKIRQSVLSKETSVPPVPEIVEQIISACRLYEKNKLQKVVNATGIIIHTNMGRAPLLRDVWREAEQLNCGYSNLEFDLQTGKRGKRKGLIPLLMSLLVGSEDACIVNNNAAAVFLMLSTFARDREVIVSRGEQVQIGGGFRIPEILESSGACLVAVGTTNITTANDYRKAFSDHTAMMLSVHRSNFALRGFATSPSTKELADIKPEGVMLCIDQGSGVTTETIPGETTVGAHIANGADLVSFSGDKILAGPQAGIIAGKKDLIAKMEKNPLMRVFRPGKTVYSLLELTLLRHMNGRENSNPYSISMQELKTRGRRVLSGINRQKASIIDSTFTTGGGTAPDESFPSLSVAINSKERPEQVLQTFREASPSIIGTIFDDTVHLNLATIGREEIPHVRKTLQTILGA